MIWFFVSLFAWLGVVFFRKKYWKVFYLFLLVFSSFRYYVGSDFDDYVILFENSVLGYFVPVEPSYYFISRFLFDLGFNFQSLIAFYAFMTFFFVYRGLVAAKLDVASIGIVVFFIYVVFYFPSLSIMRQSLSSAIAFYACYRFLHNNKILSFSIFILLSFLMHYSGALFFLCIPFYYLRLKRSTYVVLIIFSFFISITFFADILSFLSVYLGLGYKGYIFKSLPIDTPIFYIFTFILIFVFFYSLHISRGDNNFLMNIVFFLIILRILSIDFKPMNRVGAGFSIFLTVFLCQVVLSRFNESSKKIAFVCMFPIIFISDYFRANKDYSYYQYSVNFCVYGDPCPISIVGDLPLEMLLIREEIR